MDKRSGIQIESPGINVATVKKDDDGWKFLMVRRADSETYPGLWGFVTGSKEGNETVPQLAIRELAEETGLIPERLWASEHCMQFYEPTVDRVWVLPVIVAVVSPGAAVRLCHENCEYRWVSGVEAVGLAIWKNLQEAISDIDLELQTYPAPNWVELPIEK
jgi:dATP pyrophosphohydrolase